MKSFRDFELTENKNSHKVYLFRVKKMTTRFIVKSDEIIVQILDTTNDLFNIWFYTKFN